MEKMLAYVPPFREGVNYPFEVVDYNQTSVKLTNPFITWRLRVSDIEYMKANHPVGSTVFLFEPPEYYWN